MDLYEPLYIQRPRGGTGVLRLAAAANATAQDLAGRHAEFDRPRGEQMKREPAAGCACCRRGPGRNDDGDSPARPQPAADSGHDNARRRWQSLTGTRAKACNRPPEAGNVGNLFQYAIATPVTLAPPTVGHAADRQRRRGGRKAFDLQRRRAGQASALRTAVHQHDRPAPDAGPDHRVRRRRLRRRRQDRRPAARQPTAYQLRLGPRHRSGPAEQGPARGIAERAAAEGHADRHAEVRPHDRVHREELRQAAEDRVDRIPDRADVDAGCAREAGGEDPRSVSLRASRPSRASRSSFRSTSSGPTVSTWP